MRSAGFGAVRVVSLGLALAAVLVPIARGDIDPLSGIDFVRIGAAGNTPYDSGIPGHPVNGRGGVGYEYSIGKYEVTSAQWAEFFSAAFDRAPGDTIPHLIPPTFWGGVPTTPTHTENPSAMRWTTTPQSAMLPTGNISWRMAAIYCNWLCNGKSSDRSAFLNGAYDVSTFGGGPLGFTDQLTHSPGAQYWIPTGNEWMKAAYYDPDKPNAGGTTGGWWSYSNWSDSPYVYGPPGIFINGLPAQANAGWDVGEFGMNPFNVPLGAYANVASPWGLYDMAGATTEWTEFADGPGAINEIRAAEGSAWTLSAGGADRILANGGGTFPSNSQYFYGFRIASSVPTPGIMSVLISGGLVFGRRYRQGGSHVEVCIGRRDTAVYRLRFHRAGGSGG